MHYDPYLLAGEKATLANGGVNPLSEERIFSVDTTRMVMASVFIPTSAMHVMRALTNQLQAPSMAKFRCAVLRLFGALRAIVKLSAFGFTGLDRLMLSCGMYDASGE